MATNGSFAQQEQYKNTTEQYTATSGATAADTGSASGNDLSKDEVGWYFVEQYYTTLSKSPERLHLFYGKRSQFVSGLEAEVAPVSVGRNAIQERIKQLDFQDCKVRVSNVDSQASFDNIVIQVIGETSNKSDELKKFVQTFVLAQQPTGYFVLNDIFRYINEEGEDEVVESTQEETAATGPLVEDVEMPKAQPAAEEPASTPLDAEVVDQKLEETIETEPVPEVAPSTNGTEPAVVEAEDAPVAATQEEEVATPEVAAKEVEEEIKELEKPKDPAPSPAPVPAQALPKPAPVPSGPPKPLTWASRAAAAAGTPKPAVPVVAPKSTATPPAQPRAAPAAKPTPAPTPAAATAPAGKENEKPTNGAGSEWQSVGSDHAKRQNRPQSISAAPTEKEGTMGYVRNVSDKVATEDLKAALGSFGNMIYFDINRSKNCAFVEYANAEGYQAAAAANPHQVSGEAIYVEPRRPKAGAYGGNGYAPNRGGMNQRGRGGFPNRGRGGGGAPRGRGTAPAA